jgi:ABC-type bacteriocin/lantibiotic exporter with double-glycine peptidase domain
MRLILGFETPWSGVVSFDGQDLADLDVAAVRRQMGTVLQTSMPFGTTYRECICGPLQISDERLWQVIAESGLEPEVRARGLDVPIGDGGGAISGGQRQRLMIARALASDPRVILLDEATSALDNVTQAIVMRSILGQTVTRVAIAHRLTTVERADRILVVSGGRIVEEGAPADLLASGGHFARLAARQEY